jgi:hypothetical protein
MTTHILVGKTVLYTISAADALAMNARRPHPLQEVNEGETYPMMIMSVAEGSVDLQTTFVNGMVFPDGYDLHRVTGVMIGTTPGTFTGVMVGVTPGTFVFS